jgi:hypothetical protein
MTTPKLFPVQENPYYGIYPGKTTDGLLMIAFVGFDYIIAARFAPDGKLMGANYTPWTRPKIQPEGKSIDARAEAQDQEFELTQAQLRKLGFASFETVSVQKFWLEGTAIGITQYPSYLADVLEPHEREYDNIDPAPLPPYEQINLEVEVEREEEELADLRENLRKWRERGDFVLYHGNDYWCGPEGKVHSS